jgi:FkbM family methyltransferase
MNRATRFSCTVRDLLDPISSVEVGQQTLRFYCPNNLALWRARTLFTKEPETLAWIDSFVAGETLLDVGANVGIYTLYAALRGHKVLAIEPEAQNYALLNRNIYLNRMHDRITALNLALSDVSRETVLNLSTLSPASALHSVETSASPPASRNGFQQGVLALTLDDFLGTFSGFFPRHIKIDVDGNEALIIRGADKTLRDTRLRSVLIEIDENLAADRDIVSSMAACGFPGFERRHSSLFDCGPYEKIFNYIFRRA